WHINDYCNFGCSYCFFPKFKEENPLVGRLSPTEVFEALRRTGRSWHLFIAGGEPLLYPNFIELVNLLKTEHPIQISTNLSNRNVKAFAEQVSPENIIVINASLHLPHHNEKSLRKFIANYHLLRSKGFEIIVSYVTFPPLLGRMKDDFRYLHEQGVEYVIPCTYNGIHEGRQYPGSYTETQARIISDVYQEQLELRVVLDMMHYQGQMCRAGKDYFHMELDGEVSRCCTIKESHGNLFQGTFSPNAEPLPCSAETCHDHCHGMMSLLESPKAPMLREPSLVDKGLRHMEQALKRFVSPKDGNDFRTVTREMQKQFVRLIPSDQEST
ncbi:MAG: radical SAM protein, partial [Flavobacteriales bacterium]|nr:radical SAM protein [Flavobacteriales bacterium]